MRELKKLNEKDLDEISSFLYNTVSEFILSRVPKKEIVDIDISVKIEYEDELDVYINAELFLDELSDSDPQIVGEAVSNAYRELELFLERFREP